MKAKLPSTDAPGWKNKNIFEFGRYGDVVLWSLEEDSDDRHRNIFVIVNGVLISVASANQIELQPERVPTSTSQLEDLLRESMLGSDRPGFSIVWEALGLPLAEREVKVAEARRKHDTRESERQERYAKEEREKTSREEASHAKTVEKLRAGEAVGGTELLNAARRLGVEVHPRVAGVLSNNVEWVSPERMSLRKKSTSQGPFQLYRELRLRLAV